MLRGQKLAKIIEDIEEKFDNLTEFFQNGKNEKPATINIDELNNLDYTPNWGIQNGLTIVVDTMSDWNPASLQQDFLGVQAAIKGKNQFPIISRDSFLIKPGVIH